MKTYNRESKARHSRLSNDREDIQLRIEIKTLKAVETLKIVKAYNRKSKLCDQMFSFL